MAGIEPVGANPDIRKIPENLDELVHNFWVQLKKNWAIMHLAMLSKNTNDHNNVLNLLQFFAQDLCNYIDFEVTIGQLNCIGYEKAKELVELYISPRLLQNNVPVMNAIVDSYEPIQNLQVFKYRAYNRKNPAIKAVEYTDFTVNYTDFGAQWFSGINEQKEHIINIVIWVRKNIAEKILEKKEVTFIDKDKPDAPIKLAKWLPKNVNVVDIFLTNIIGEYNLVHRTGYIEFLPEGDPLIAEGSVFHELQDLQAAYSLVDLGDKCSICDRTRWQTKLSKCSKCKKTWYCCKLCQVIDFKTHNKNFCN